MQPRTPHQEKRRNIAVGLTAVGGLVGLVLLLAAFGYVPALMRSGYEVTIYMENVGGLRENSRVTLWGQQVGEVKEVGFAEPGKPERTYVKLLIDQRYEVPKDVDVRVERPLFGGGPVVAFVGSAPGSESLVMDGSAVLNSAQVVDPAMKIEAVSDDLAELKVTWGQVGDNINTLFGSPDDAGMPSLPRVVMGLEERLAQLDRVFSSAEEWLTDEQLRKDVTQTASNARELTETLDKTVTALEQRYIALAESAESRLVKVDKTLDTAVKTLDDSAASIEQIERRYVALADDASKVVAVIDQIVKQANSKDSTIGLLLNDPQLYRNLTDTSERLKIMTDEARLLIEKWKTEGIRLRVFN